MMDKDTIEEFQTDMTLLALYELGGKGTTEQIAAHLEKKFGAKWFGIIFEGHKLPAKTVSEK